LAEQRAHQARADPQQVAGGIALDPGLLALIRLGAGLLQQGIELVLHRAQPSQHGRQIIAELLGGHRSRARWRNCTR
jgi:hypothetical protein